MSRGHALAAVLVGALLADTGNAQTVLFEEDFDAGIPATWTNIQLDYLFDQWMPGFGLVNGTGDVFHEEFCDLGVFNRDNILLSPPIDLSGVTTANFKCDQHHFDAASIDYNAIEVTTDGGTNYTVLHEVISPSNGASSITANMDAFVGFSSVQIALHYKGSIANGWSVDNIEVSSPWTDLGHSLAGTYGDPLLSGEGSLIAGDAMSIVLSNALESTPAFLFVGFSELNFSPFFGGTLVPDFNPPGLLVVVVTNGAGGLSLGTTWPTGIPPGFDLYLQYWIEDAVGPFGFSATNAIKGTTP